MYIQLAPFHLAPGVDERTLLAASDRFQTDFVSRQDGILERVVMRSADGGYADLVFFADRAASDRLLAAEATSPERAAFFAVLEHPADGQPDMGVLSFEPVRSYGPAGPTPVLECVFFRPAAGVGRGELVAAAAGIESWAKSQQGFVSRELFELGDGRWVDLVRWATMPDALAAAEAAAISAACAAFLALIDPAAVEMLHGTAALPAVRA